MDNGEDVVAPPISGQGPHPWAWIVLATLFIVIIGSQLSDYLRPQSQGYSSAQAEITLKQYFTSKQFLTKAGEKASVGARKDIDRSLRTVYDEAKKHSSSPEAASVVLVTGHELGLPVDVESLRTLSKSAKSRDRALGKIYSSDTLSMESAKALKKDLPETFFGKAAYSHALERAGDKNARENLITSTDVAAYFGFIILAVLSVAGGVVVWIAFAVWKSTGGLTPAGSPVSDASRADKDRFALRMAVFLVGLLLIPGTVAALFRGSLVKGAAAFIGELVFIAGFLYFLALPVLGRPDPLKKLIGDVSKTPRLVFFGFCGFLANLPVLIVLLLIMNFVSPGGRASHPIGEQIGSGVSPLTLLMFWLLAGILAPFMEELTFRGLLFPALTKFVSPIASVFISGFLFGAIHPQGPLLWLSLGAIGAMGAYLTHLTKSLVPAMVMHCIHNSAILALSVVMLY
ncbi:MAG: CPBP family intramembrane metalloprotease [Chthonomonadaceae bacterium]|nr:CPBP family intramembrane metalloprotease [Chthonomonadaceae bacterium]